jgi:hypothetical protein
VSTKFVGYPATEFQTYQYYCICRLMPHHSYCYSPGLNSQIDYMWPQKYRTNWIGWFRTIETVQLQSWNQASSPPPLNSLMMKSVFRIIPFFRKQPAALAHRHTTGHHVTLELLQSRCTNEQLLTKRLLRPENVSSVTIVINGFWWKQWTWGISELHCFFQVSTF